MKNKSIYLLLTALFLIFAGIVSAEGQYTISISETDHVKDYGKTWYIDLSIPSVKGLADKKTEDELNSRFLEWRDTLVKEYKFDTEEMLDTFDDSDLPHFGYEYDWEIIVDTDDYFVFKTASFYAAGSSMTVNEYWTIDKHSGELVELSDLADNTRLEEIRDMILESMKKINEEQEVFWVEEGDFDNAFSYVDDYHHWYVNENNNLVITFDKYEIAPGAYGESRFEITEDQAVLIEDTKYSFDISVADTTEINEKNWFLHVRVPEISGLSDEEEESQMNLHFVQMADSVRDEFKTSVATAEESISEGNEPHFGYEYYHEVLADTDDYFSFKTVSFYAAGSSMTSNEFWTLSKKTGRLLKWEDVEPVGGIEKIHDQIFAEMTAANDAGNGLYYTDDESLNFSLSNIDNSHHWYLNSDGNLVIAFDKYEIAVGAQGTPEFIIK